MPPTTSISPTPTTVMPGASSDCGCNDYSHLTARTGLNVVSVANPNLDGTGTLAQILQAADNGTIIKSIIIKAIQPNTTGMVRLFIANADKSIITLFREIPMPINPALSSTPTPTPVLPMLEIDLVQEFKLMPRFYLLASTQNSESFNVIAEGLDWAYPETLPGSCCNYIQYTANTGVGFPAPNTNLDGITGTYNEIFTATALKNGSVIKSITIAALQSTSINSMVRLFVGPSGGPYYLMMEIMVPQTNQSAFIPSFKVLMKEDYHLHASYVIAATTQVTESFAITIEGEDWIYPPL